jgi:hypothetical protein
LNILLHGSHSKLQNIQNDEITPKKQKFNDFNIANRLNKTPIQSPKGCGSSDEDQENAPLSPDQRLQIEQNRLSAKMIKASRESHGLLTNIGPSWFKALEAEFSKPYFIKVKFPKSSTKLLHDRSDRSFSWPLPPLCCIAKSENSAHMPCMCILGGW